MSLKKSKDFSHNRVLVTGGAGSIGSELVRQLVLNNQVYVYDNNETGMFDLVEELRFKGFDVLGRVGDVRNKDTLMSVFLEFQPHVVYHAAALKHVTPSMWTPREYVETNILGTLNVLELGREFDTPKIVNISTDKVVNAESIMGATKNVAEIAVKVYNRVSVRFGNVMGSRGSLLTIWEKQHKEGLPLTITDERMERYFMTIPQAVNLVIEAGKVAKSGKVVILDMGQPKKIIDLKNELYGDYPHKVIGIRPGETLTERLITDDEAQRARKVSNFWII